MTPYELNIVIDEFNKQQESSRENERYMSYLTARFTAAFVWSKKIPEYKECFKENKPEKRATNEEMLEEFKKINAAFGGNVY